MKKLDIFKRLTWCYSSRIMQYNRIYFNLTSFLERNFFFLFCCLCFLIFFFILYWKLSKTLRIQKMELPGKAISTVGFDLLAHSAFPLLLPCGCHDSLIMYVRKILSYYCYTFNLGKFCRKAEERMRRLMSFRFRFPFARTCKFFYETFR